MTEAAEIVVDSSSHMRNMARAKRDEEELKMLMEKHNGKAQESEPDSESVEDTQVQVEGDTQQKEASTQTEAPEAEPKLSKEEESFKKRYSDIREYMRQKEEEHKAELSALKQQIEAAAKNKLVLPKTDADIDAWAKKYPDVYQVVKSIADKQAQEKTAELDSRVKEIETMRSQARKDKAEAELMSFHPDFAQIRSDDAFHEWAEQQPKWVQDALYDNLDDAKSVARVIDLYKADKGITTKSKSSSDKAAAASVKSRSRSAPEADESNNYYRESQVSKMSAKEYEKQADKIMEAIRSDKFIYDLSKK